MRESPPCRHPTAYHRYQQSFVFFVTQLIRQTLREAALTGLHIGAKAIYVFVAAIRRGNVSGTTLKFSLLSLLDHLRNHICHGFSAILLGLLVILKLLGVDGHSACIGREHAQT